MTVLFDGKLFLAPIKDPRVRFVYSQ